MHGPTLSVIATLMDHAEGPARTRQAEVTHWRMGGKSRAAPSTASSVKSTAARANSHRDGSGTECGVDMRGLHKQLANLNSKELHGREVLIQAAAGGLWPAARPAAGGNNYVCWCWIWLNTRTEVEETMLHKGLHFPTTRPPARAIVVHKVLHLPFSLYIAATQSGLLQKNSCLPKSPPPKIGYLKL